MIIRASLNLTKVDKTKLFRSDKTDGVYLNITLLENKNGTDDYGNHFMIVQDVGKEAREAGEKGAILGNGKIAGDAGQPRQTAKPAAKIQPEDAPW